MEGFIRRAYEIDLALIVDYIYQHNKSTQTMIDFIDSACRIVGVEDPSLVTTAALSYKQLMPTAEELVVISDLTKSRQKFIQSDIIKQHVCRTTFYAILKRTPQINEVLKPKCKFQISDAIAIFVNEFTKLSKAFGMLQFNLEEE